MRWRLRRWWEAITEPRHLSAAFFFAYIIATLTGIATFVAPPMTIEGEIGPVLASMWAGLLVLGGALGMVTVLPGWWAWERWACRLILASALIYGVVIVSLHFTTPGSRATQTGYVMFGLVLFTVRLMLIWGRSYAPRK